ncbi:PGF-pre-PGF domain-containing protein [Haloarcula sp. CBA1130]|uniref:CARDB domain-containing protein n=1 Tax=unclassified Haloarcula TaxID=2624677 RepID=UPI001247053B|nr:MULTISPECIES: CARDB domain-containing protein [unclassified Haloarcula]KAA9398641.1 PGF-pre-PGF domain-containing protein [Haloarcula sp. CBA1129]KAA9403158.1 PGF-pre-PGF domain-containing protein [Haloarcula sp. CBA1130]
MVREERSPKQHLPSFLSVCVVVLLLAATAAGPVAAAPRLFVSGASKEANTILAGESVNVTATVKNTGSSGGAMSVEYMANGTTKATERVAVDAGSSVKRTRALKFDTPGTYQISVKGPERSAGLVRVKKATAVTVRQDATSRKTEVRGGAVPTAKPYEVEMPSALNRTFTVQTWTVNASQRSFTQNVTEYTDPADAGITVPDNEDASVFGVVTVGSSSGVQPSSMQFVLNRSNLQSAGIDASAVRVYHRVNGSWRAAETSVVEERTDQVVYEADTAGASAYAIGKIEPAFSITRTSVVSEQVPEGQQVVVEATVSNSGGIEGTYDARMRVEDEVVNRTSVTVPADTERTVTLSTVVTTPGRFQIKFNNVDAGNIRVAESEVQTDGNGGAEPEAEPTGTEPAVQTEPAVGGDGGLGPLPATVMGISTVLVIGGLLGALLLFGLVIALLRRGGNRNDSGFEL